MFGDGAGSYCLERSQYCVKLLYANKNKNIQARDQNLRSTVYAYTSIVFASSTKESEEKSALTHHRSPATDHV